MKNYKIDFTHNTIIIDYKFAKAAQNVNSAEYKTLKQITNDFPYMTSRVASHREIKGAHHNKHMSYSAMVDYISTYENSAELLAEFALVKAQAGSTPHSYSTIRRWFVDKFPDYTKPISIVKPIPKTTFKSIESEFNNYDTKF